MEKSEESNREDVIKQYDKNIAAAHEKIQKQIKKKIKEVEMQRKIIAILNDSNKEGRQKIIEALKNKNKNK